MSVRIVGFISIGRLVQRRSNWRPAQFVALFLALFGISGFSLPITANPALAQDTGAAQSQPTQVDFQRDIYPILEAKCFECHSGEASDGDLRLHNEAYARRGGHTGRPLLVSPAEDSELYRRLISTEEGYRMPKSGEPLSAEEIELFEAWLEQGAKWIDAGPSGTAAGENKSTAGPDSKLFEWFGQILFEFFEASSQPRFRYLGVMSWILGAWLLFAVLVLATKLRQFRRRRKSFRMPTSSTTTREEIPHTHLTDRVFHWRNLFLALAAIIVTSVFLYQQGVIAELKESFRRSTTSVRRQPAIKITENRKALVLPIYPDHPPRLGGTYYRGNDERDPSLFNGGVYRTATMEVGLVNEKNEKIQWNDRKSEGPLFISLVIRRAPRTTSALFSESIFRETYLRRFRESDLVSGNQTDESGEVPFSVVEPEQAWEASVPLEPISDWKDGRNAGVIYVFYGSQVFDGFKGRVHYGIRYDLSIKEGKISPDSVLWMGAIYDLGGRVLIPENEEVPLSQWFDYRPLPEIEYDNPDDPALLGLPEHLRKTKDQ